MRKLIFVLLLIAPFLCLAQSESKTSFGVGLGTFSYFSHLYYYRFDATPSRYNYPEHRLNRVMLILTGEQSHLFNSETFQFDGTAELGIGLGGKTRGLWLPQDEVISKGGFAVSANASLRMGYPLQTKPAIMPFVSLGPQLAVIYNNGKGLGSNFASRPYYYYGEGWTEYFIMLAGSLGASFDVSGYSIIPEFRFGIVGSSITNWEPNEEGVKMDRMPGMVGFTVKVCKTF